jgi:hypothetical protein
MINHEINIVKALTFREQTTTMHYDCLMNLIIPVCFDFRSPEILDMTRLDQTNNSKTIGNHISRNINLLHDIATKLLEQVEFSHLLMLHSAKYCSDPVQLIPPIPIVLELLV